MKTPIKYHGGKHYLASKIVNLFPQSYRNYVEPFAGGLSVLFANNPNGHAEIVNDIDSDVANFWGVLRSEELFPLFQRRVEATAFDQHAFNEAVTSASSNPVVRAWAFFVIARQSLAGRQGTFAPLTTSRLRRGMNEQASAWLSAVEGLPEVHERLKRVAVLNIPALDVIEKFDHPTTLFYLDPPYLPETRTAPKVYRHEMSREDHVKLLGRLLITNARIVLSGYPNELYDGML